MFLKLKAASISMHSYADLPDEKGVGSGRQTFGLSVHLDGGDHIDLETGEVFQSPRRSNNKNGISGFLTLEQAKTDGHYTYNRMTYCDEIVSDDPMVSNPSQILFTVFVPPGDFQELVSNSRNGLLPSTIMVELQHDILGESSPIKFGWEPDGSGKKWLNRDEKNKHIKIQGISFHYDVLTPVEDHSTDFATAESFNAEHANAHARQIREALGSLRTDLKTVGWVALISAFAIAYYLKH
jgi:hypothetical protein